MKYWWCLKKKKASEIRYWIEEFQKTMHKTEVNQQLKSTAEIWTKEENPPTPANQERVQMVMNNELPFLDIKISWASEGDLQLEVLRKNRQQLKYV